ncbi:MAG: hypothetical protein N3H31_02700 [Candidatus Nezhaarchaeota archaeon]|nr:hypothetical protein [Candidatus Nezhaarchaeota archaeon]
MSTIKSTAKVHKVAAGEVHNVFYVELVGLGEGSIKKIVVELPKQIQVFKEGMEVEVEVSTRPIPWGEEAELYLNGRVFAAKRGGAENTFYFSIGGLQLRLVVEGDPLKVEPMSKVYIAFKVVGS